MFRSISEATSSPFSEGFQSITLFEE